MSDSIQVGLTPDTLHTAADGNPVKATILVRNMSAVVDQYVIELDGLPPEWYSAPGTSRALFPQDQEEAKLVLHVPKNSGVTAGSHPFTVSAVSRADPTQRTRAKAMLQVEAVVPIQVDLSPRKMTGRKGRYTVIVRNGGNTNLDLDLEARDADDACRYTFKPSMPQLGAGRQISVRLAVRPERSGLIGQPKQFDFEVTARPSQGEAKTVQGQLVHTPRLRTFKPVRNLIAVGAVVAILAVPFRQNPIKQFICTNTAICTWLSNGKQQIFGAVPHAPALTNATTWRDRAAYRLPASPGRGAQFGVLPIGHPGTQAVRPYNQFSIPADGRPGAFTSFSTG